MRYVIDELKFEADADVKCRLVGEVEGAFCAEVVDLCVHVFGEDVGVVDASFYDE